MKKLLHLSILLPFISWAQITPQQVVDLATSYHDPKGQWMELSAKLNFTETRPSGNDRFSSIDLDNTRSYMKINRNDEEIYETEQDSCKVLAGDKEISRGLMLRNYYLYLWGLPMKLNDDETPFDSTVTEETMNGISCYVLRVPYEKDTWYFHIDKSTGRMVEYKFYQDEEESKGEVIKLEDEIEVGQMKIPQKRSWYTLPEMKYLGTDILTKSE